ncbi:MAG: DPP IV N-terminal domain-containing protein [Saprospiraceae bacterium]|nr:DPP IV N-terminal domain-containing protein [Saprospiraceae bacterium]
MKNLLITSLALLCTVTSNTKVFGQNVPLGIFENHLDVGPVANQGSITYDSDLQEYTIEGSGTNMWSGQDEFQYLWKSIQGDFILRTEVRFIGEGVDPHRKIGWMVRSRLSTDSPHANACVHGDGLTSLQYRKTKGAETEQIQSEQVGPDVIQLERMGDQFIMSTAHFGEPLQSLDTLTLVLPTEVFAGLYVCSHNPDVMETAVFRNVRIIKPAPHDLVPYQTYLGSNLEVMNVESGRRANLMYSAHSLQAPNWTPDGEHLIYNSHGILYNYDLSRGQSIPLNTGFADRNNNDHVLSFDGDQIAISHHSSENDGASTIYILPSEGSETPRQITKNGMPPSYLHGWSVDAGNLVFTGNRNDKYDIYQVSVETGEETQLTDTEGLDDGPEYSPDGKYIYFNSTRTGTMQLWRMGTDGSNPTQLTFDEYNDWFPHISPDNKSIVFISYQPDVEPAAHPFYKQVMLRIMPVDGGEPRVIGYLYGGQGSINVPSWAPDSKHIAFVSNSN